MAAQPIFVETTGNAEHDRALVTTDQTEGLEPVLELGLR
jgi:hypothetical protein